MSHDIEINDHGIGLAVYNRQPAWHGLGTVIDDPNLSISDAMRIAQLSNWNVRTEPIHTINNLPVPGLATIRTNPTTGEDEVLGNVGDRYHPIQNEEVAEAAEAFLDSGLVVEAAGSINHGRRAFMLFRMPEDISIAGDPMTPYLAALNSHDGSTAVTYVDSVIRWVCRNTINMGLANARRTYKVRHTAQGMKGRVAEARDALDITFERVDAFTAEVEKWLDMTVKHPEPLIDALFPIPDDTPAKTITTQLEKRRAVLTVYNGPTIKNIHGTAWGLLQAAQERDEWKQDKDKAPDPKYRAFNHTERNRDALVLRRELQIA